MNIITFVTALIFLMISVYTLIETIHGQPRRPGYLLIDAKDWLTHLFKLRGGE